MNYRIVHIDTNPEDNQRPTNPEDNQRPITESEYNKIKTAADCINKVMESLVNWQILNKNIKTFKTRFADKNCIWGYKDGHAVLNDEYSKWLNAYYLWKCFNNHKWEPWFCDRMKEERNKNVELRLVDDLRNCIAHNGFIITDIHYDVLNETTSFIIKPEAILNAKRTKPIDSNLELYLQELIKKGEEIDANEVLEFSEKTCGIIQRDVMEHAFEELKQALNLLRSYMPKEPIPFINTYVENDGDKSQIALGPLLRTFFEKLSVYSPTYLARLR